VNGVYTSCDSKKTDLWRYSMRKISSAMVCTACTRQTHETRQRRVIGSGGWTWAERRQRRRRMFDEHKNTRVRSCRMDDWRVVRWGQHLTPPPPSPHTLSPSLHHTTLSPPPNIIRKLTAAKRKMEIRFPVFRFCRMTK